MNYTDYRISLDIFKTVSQATLPVKQGDTAYRLCITLSANGSPYIITDKCYALFTAKKPDGNFINNKCTIENNTIYYELTKQTTAAIGMVECEIVLYDDNDEQLATPHFNILVDVKAYNGEKITSSSEVNMLEDLIAESEAQIADVEEKLANGEFKGEKGDAGSIKFIVVAELPTENIDESAIYMKASTNPKESNTYEEFIYTDGAWESLGTAQVEVDLTDYVKNTDFATQGKGGVVKVFTGSHGLWINGSGILGVSGATETEINNGAPIYKPITVDRVDYAVKKALADCKLTTWEDEEKAAARLLLGAIGGTDLGGYRQLGLMGVAGNANETGLQITNGLANIFSANKERIDAKTSNATPLVPKYLDYAVKVGLTTNTETLTAEEQAKAQGWLGVPTNISGYCNMGVNHINYPFIIDETKTYNASVQLAYAENGSTSVESGYFENVTFTDGALTLNLDQSGLYFVGVKIFVNKFYDGSLTDKAGWLCAQSEMGAYSGATYNYNVILTEA